VERGQHSVTPQPRPRRTASPAQPPSCQLSHVCTLVSSQLCFTTSERLELRWNGARAVSHAPAARHLPARGRGKTLNPKPAQCQPLAHGIYPLMDAYQNTQLSPNYQVREWDASFGGVGQGLPLLHLTVSLLVTESTSPIPQRSAYVEQKSGGVRGTTACKYSYNLDTCARNDDDVSSIVQMSLGSRCNDRRTASYYTCPTFCDFNVTAAGTDALDTTTDMCRAHLPCSLSGRGLHSSTFRLNITTCRGIRWAYLLVSESETAQVELRCGRV
jgi:hypothetical protein